MARFGAGFPPVRLFVLASISFFAAATQAQVTNVSDVEATPIPGAGHNYTGMLNETVDPANGSLSVRINVPIPGGRNLIVPFAFAYDSNSAISIAAEPWTVTVAYLFQLGWTYTAPVENLQTARLSGTYE